MKLEETSFPVSINIRIQPSFRFSAKEKKGKPIQTAPTSQCYAYQGTCAHAQEFV